MKFQTANNWGTEYFKKIDLELLAANQIFQTISTELNLNKVRFKIWSLKKL